MYIFSIRENAKQYKISIKDESVVEFNDKNNLQTYNGKWEDMTLSDAINGKLFNNYYTNDIKGYDKVDKVGKLLLTCIKKKMIIIKFTRADIQIKK